MCLEKSGDRDRQTQSRSLPSTDTQAWPTPSLPTHGDEPIYRYQSRRDDSSLRARLKVLADPKSPSLQRPRFGYRRLHALLSREGRVVNHKRVYRLYCEEGLTLPWRGRKRRAAGKRVPLERPTGVNERWSVDFIHDQLGSGSRFRVLNVVDDFSRECLACEVDSSLPGERVVRVLDRLVDLRGKPGSIVLDNGPEFVGRAMDRWAYGHGVRLSFIPPGRPLKNAFVESFNGRLRDPKLRRSRTCRLVECLNLHWFMSLAEARRVIEEWRLDYNQQIQRIRPWPHSSLGYLTPAEFARSDKTRRVRLCGFVGPSGLNSQAQGRLDLRTEV